MISQLLLKYLVFLNINVNIFFFFQVKNILRILDGTSFVQFQGRLCQMVALRSWGGGCRAEMAGDILDRLLFWRGDRLRSARGSCIAHTAEKGFQMQFVKRPCILARLLKRSFVCSCRTMSLTHSCSVRDGQVRNGSVGFFKNGKLRVDF